MIEKSTAFDVSPRMKRLLDGSMRRIDSEQEALQARAAAIKKMPAGTARKLAEYALRADEVDLHGRMTSMRAVVDAATDGR